jgi:hypothetical protein
VAQQPLQEDDTFLPSQHSQLLLLLEWRLWWEQCALELDKTTLLLLLPLLTACLLQHLLLGLALLSTQLPDPTPQHLQS